MAINHFTTLEVMEFFCVNCAVVCLFGLGTQMCSRSYGEGFQVYQILRGYQGS